jgi:hypothetical protein
MPRRALALAALFYAGLAALLASILLGLLPHVLPDELAVRIGYNSEGFALALLLAPWIQFVRPRLTARSDGWRLTVAAAVGSVAVGLALFASDLPSAVKTLNETFVAFGLMLPYVQARRPMPVRLAVGCSLAILAAMVLGERTEIVTRFAESLGALLLLPLALDVVDRGILDPDARTSARLRWAWYALLLALPVLFSTLQHGGGLTGLPAEAVRYAVRLHESVIGILLVEVYFAVLLGRTGRSRRSDPRSAADPPSRVALGSEAPERTARGSARFGP